MVDCLKCAIFVTEIRMLNLNTYAYEKEKSRKLCKIGQKAWQCRIFYLLLPMSTRRERAKAPANQLNKQLTEMDEARRLLAIRSRKDLHTAEIYFDVSKLIFGGVVIGSLLDAKENWIYLLIIGTIMFFVLLWIGNRYYNQGNNSI